VLQDDASLSVAEIGDRVGLSSSRAGSASSGGSRRVILRRVAMVSRKRSGLAFRFFVSSRARIIPNWLRTSPRRQRHAEVMEFYRMAGDVD